MTEVVRAMRESGYQPYRTFLFIAYSGEGLEGGERVDASDVRKFLQARPGFSSSLDIEAIVHLRGLGSGEGRDLVLSSTGGRRLLKLFQDSARQVGVPYAVGQQDVDISIVFEDRSRRERGQDAPEPTLGWEGWDTTSRLPSDTMEAISSRRIQQAGEALTLALMVLGREQNY